MYEWKVLRNVPLANLERTLNQLAAEGFEPYDIDADPSESGAFAGESAIIIAYREQDLREAVDAEHRARNTAIEKLFSDAGMTRQHRFKRRNKPGT